MSGNGPLAELATLKEYVMPLRPRIILWCYFEQNDFTDLLRERKSPLLRSYLNEGFSQDLLHRQNVIDKALSEYAVAFEARPHESRNPRLTALQFVAGTLKLVQVRQMLDLVFNRSDPETDREEYGQQQMDLFKTILLQAKTLTQSWGGELYFVYLPAPDALQRDGYHRSAVLSSQRVLIFL